MLLFSKLGDNCGKAEISLDGTPVEIVDTYSADDIWGVCIFKKDLGQAGRHTIRITVLGEQGTRSTGSAVFIDGIRVER